ncbi:hypothetical protein KO02_04820 [Sphingobacterium sp. ML3W]|uniref:hypothetical protein n=1 Tax=Sphingobacterium sp. ML3W TaxID=1538644 RepID=UPI0004F84B24|nr:hypothetical protein [Sphingobacterium sp. ML3W]AIM36089.1 hypothetical protein KO02_04820 [Sphingobacterium sp. ML3W]
MQKICNRESYALSTGEDMSFFLSEMPVPIIKKPVMITDLPEQYFKELRFDIVQGLSPKSLKYVMGERTKQPYYSLLINLLETSDSFSMVVRNDSIDVLRISLISMEVYEIYLFALGLPADFPTNRILVLGEEREKLVPNDKLVKTPCYCYELTVPANTEREEYRQRILNDMNKHFQLDVRVDKLAVVQGSRKVLTISGESVELIWDEQLMMIIKSNKVNPS